MDGYRLRSSRGDTIDPTQPLPVDTVEGQSTTSVSKTLTYNGKAAAGAVSIASLPIKPIIENLGSRVGSFWDNTQNSVYFAFADGNVNKAESWLSSVTETATSAAITIYDPNKNLEEMFESVTGSVKRFIVKVKDKDGGSLYGWVMGVSVSSDVYTFQIMNNRLSETQSWVGTLSAFDNTSLDSVEIFYYNSSIAFGTGTCFTEEVKCPKEYSKNRQLQLEYAETLSNGQYFVDSMRGELIGVKADTTASETVTYNVWSSLAGGGTSLTSDINLDQVGGTATVNGGVAGSLGVGGNVAHDAVDAGNPVKVGARARSGAITAVAQDDRTDLISDLYGQLVLANHTWASSSARTEEIDPLSTQYVLVNLVDTTNVSAATHYYPSATGASMDGYKDQSLTGKLIDADGTLTLTLEVSNDEDSATADWNGAYFYDDELNATVASKTVTNGTELFSLSVNNNNFYRYRWVVVASGATNTVIIKERKKY